MVQRLEGLVFEIEVDPKTGEARLRNFSRTVEREGRKMGQSAKTAAQRLGSIRNAILGIVGVAAGLQGARLAVRAFGNEIRKTTAVAGEFQLQSQQLLTLLQLQGVDAPKAAREELIEYADALGLASSASSDQLIRAEAMAIAFGATAERAKDAALASVLFSQVFTKGEIEPAIRNVVRSLGGYREELIASVPGVRELTVEQLKQGKVIDLILEQYKGLENALGFVLPIATQQAEEAFALLRRELGGPLSEVAVELLNLTTDTVTGMVAATKEAEGYRTAVLTAALASVEFAIGVETLAEVLKERFVPAGISVNQLLGFIADNAFGATDEILQITHAIGMLQGEAQGASHVLQDLRNRFTELLRGGPREPPPVPPGVGGESSGTLFGPSERPVLGFGLDEIALARTELLNLGEAWAAFQGQIAGSPELLAAGAAQVEEMALRFVELGLPLEEVTATMAAFGLEIQNINELQAPLMIDTIELIGGALHATADAFLRMAQTGQFSFRSLVNAVAQQTFGILSALAIENIVRGLTQRALALGRYAIGDVAGGTLHQASAAAHFRAAKVAGGLAAASLGVVAATSDRNDQRGGRGSAADRIASSDPAPREVTIIIEGQGFINQPEEFFRQAAEEIQREMRRGGAGG